MVLAIETREIAPGLWQSFAAGGPEESRAAGQLREWIAAFRRNSEASLIVHNFERPAAPSQGILDAQIGSGQSEAIQKLNAELAAIARENAGVYVLDYDGLVARHGRDRWHDAKKWLTVRLPMAAAHLNDMAREWLRFLHPLSGRIAKALVVDLDNTLWGGVIGEDGMDGIQLSAEHPGAYFQAVQRVLLDLYHRGILLAIASKNNPADAMEALERHPGMLLRPKHFAAMRIGWESKAKAMGEIAAELNIGIDALAFFDDNPVERQHVREEAPSVTVIEAPANASDYARALRECPFFERLTLSEEDKRRGEIYAVRRESAALQKNAATPEDFYRSLEQEVEIRLVDNASLARVAQLTQKTNQFNLTTRRYSEQEILAAARQGRHVYAVWVRDRYQDNGLVGVAMVDERDGTAEIDTFLLSCRVIGRTVETAILHHIAGQARERGAKTLRGWFLPTKKNAPSQDFYGRHGFSAVSREETGTLWERDLAEPLPCPEWIRLVIPKEAIQ